MTPDSGVSSPGAVGDDAGGNPIESTTSELRVLGLPADAGWDDIRDAHARLVADLTPGPDASHGNVALAKRLLDEVNLAFDALRARSSVA